MWSSTLNLSPFLYSPFLWLPTKDIQSLWIISLQIPGLWFLTSNIFYPNSSRDYFWQNSCKQQFHKKKTPTKKEKLAGFTFVFQVSERCVVALVPKQMSSFNIPSSASFPRSISRYGQCCLRDANTFHSSNFQQRCTICRYHLSACYEHISGVLLYSTLDKEMQH